MSLTNAVLAEEVYEFESYQDLLVLFDSLGYTEDAWNTGSREVSRV